MARADAAVDGRRSQVLAWLRLESAGSKRQPVGRPKAAAERVIGKSRFKVRLCMEFERSEMTTSKSQSMGRPKMVFTVTSEPKANEIWIGEPVVSIYGV